MDSNQSNETASQRAEFIFVDAPPPSRRGKGRLGSISPEIAARLEAIAQHPGQWLVWFAGTKSTRSGMLKKNLEKYGKFEVADRTEADGTHTTYVREVQP